MDGIFFYWFGWFFWVIFTFIVPKNKIRTIYAMWILMIIGFSNLYLSFDSIALSMSYLTLILGAFILLSTLNRKGILLFSAFTMMIGYTSLLIWEVNAPVWLFTPRIIMIPILCVCLALLLTKKLYARFVISVIGICSGEFLYSVLLYNYSITQAIGSLRFLDTLSVMVFLLVLIEAIHQGKAKLFLLLHKTNNI